MTKNIFFLALLISASLSFIILLSPLFEPILWAIIFAILFLPLYKFLLRKFGNRHSLSAFITVFIILCTVIVPATVLSIIVIGEGTNLYNDIRSGVYDFSKPVNWIQESLPAISDLLNKVGINIEKTNEWFSGIALNSSKWIVTNLLNIGQDALIFTAFFLLMLYLLFFFLRDGNKIIDLIIRVLPLGDKTERHLLSKFAETTRATIKSTLVAGLIQGTLGGVIFAILGIKSAVFWGVIMTGLSILPVAGSSLVWGPAAIIFLADGDWIKAIVLLATGTLIVGLTDNLLRPILVGRDTKMPDYLILISTIGGLILFNLSGFIIGPVIAAFFLASWAMFEEEYQQQDSLK